MTSYRIVLTDDSETTGLATGTPDEVYAYLTEGLVGVKRVEVHAADDLTWPTPDECPVLV